jgi:hypothetical protein
MNDGAGYFHLVLLLLLSCSGFLRRNAVFGNDEVYFFRGDGAVSILPGPDNRRLCRGAACKVSPNGCHLRRLPTKAL